MANKQDAKLIQEMRSNPEYNALIEQAQRDIATKLTPIPYLDPKKNPPDDINQGKISIDFYYPHHETH